MLGSPPDYPGIQGTGSKQKLGVKTQQQTKQITDYRKRIKDLKCDLALKDNEIQNLQRTLKYTKLKEYEVQLEVYSMEVLRMKKLLIAER